MHEYSLCVALLGQVEAIARQHGARRVERIELRVGPLSGAEPLLLRHAWPLVAAGTIASEAMLEIESVPVIVACTCCGVETEATPNRLLCGRCGDCRTRLVSGDELMLARLELAGIEPGQERSCV